MIPRNITRAHILRAIADLQPSRVPKRKQATRFVLIANGKALPPKLVVSRANFYANGAELPTAMFSGGSETLNYLIQVGLGDRLRELHAPAAFTPLERSDRMLVMAGKGHTILHYWQGLYGGLGHLYSPGRFDRSFDWLPYVIDNGAYAAFTNKVPWDREAFIKHCDRIKQQGSKPLWIAVPDVVRDRLQTLRQWAEWEPFLRQRYPRIPLAFVVQDGMTQADVPTSAEVVFIGGSTEWKRENIDLFVKAFDGCNGRSRKRIHVGRINTWRWLWFCHDAGVTSVDGSGYFRGDGKQLDDLKLYLQTCSERSRPRQFDLWNTQPDHTFLERTNGHLP